MSESIHFFPEAEPQTPHISARTYYTEAARRIATGEMVWVRRDIYSQSDTITWDLYLEKRHGGYVAHHLDTQRCEVYLASPDKHTSHSWSLAYDVTLEQAVHVLAEAAIRQTSH